MTTSRAVLADEAQNVHEILECLQKLTTYVFYDINSNVDLSLRLRQVKPSTICVL